MLAGHGLISSSAKYVGMFGREDAGSVWWQDPAEKQTAAEFGTLLPTCQHCKPVALTHNFLVIHLSFCSPALLCFICYLRTCAV